MITVKIKPFPGIDDIEHMATTWVIGLDEDFNTILDQVDESSEWLDIYYSPIAAPVGTTYYAKAKRHFNNGDSTWTKTIPIRDLDNDSGLILNNDVVIDKPMLSINKEELTSDEFDSFTIETSKFRGVGEGHYSTHWLIEDDFHNILLRRLSKQEDKTKIVINKKDVNIKDKNKLHFKSIHTTPSGIESPVGHSIITLADFNFEIVSDMNRVLPYTDYFIKLAKIKENAPTGIMKVEVIDPARDEIIYTKELNEDTTTIHLDGFLLGPDKKYFIDIYATNTTNDYEVKRKVLTTLRKDQTYVVDLNYVYDKELSFIRDEHETVLIDGIVTHEIYENIIPCVMRDSDKLHKLKYDRTEQRIIDTGEIFRGIGLLNYDLDNTYIKYLEDNTILVDTLSSDGLPIFMYYKYDTYTQTALLLWSCNRPDESEPIGISNACIHVTQDIIYYLPSMSKTIKKLDLKEGEVTDVVDIPNNSDSINTMISTGRNRLLIIGGHEEISWLYNMETNTFTEGTPVPPDFRNRDLKSVNLINEDSIILKQDNVDTDHKFSYLYYDAKEGVMIEKETNEINMPYLRGYVTLRHGDILLSSEQDIYSKLFKYE